MAANRKTVETGVTHPRAVAIMEELDGMPVKQIYSHHEDLAPSSATYKVVFTDETVAAEMAEK